MPEQIDQFMAPLRMSSWTYGFIGIFGLVLSAVGLAGMTAYSVAQRGREIGIRIALGAQRGNVLGLVMKEGLGLVVAGTAIGMAGAWTGSRLLSAMNSSVGQVTSTSTSDPTVLLGAPLLLGLPGAVGLLRAGAQIDAHRPGRGVAPGVRIEPMREWLRETHGPGFELLRHFLLRFFDSDLVTAPGQTATALIGAFSIFLPWFPLIVGTPAAQVRLLFQPARCPGRTDRRCAPTNCG